MPERSWHEVFRKLEAIYAYDTGSVDSGVRDETLRKELVEHIDASEDASANIVSDDFRIALSRYVTDIMLSQRSVEAGYGWEDVLGFLRWIDSGEYRGR